jgi:integrase
MEPMNDKEGVERTRGVTDRLSRVHPTSKAAPAGTKADRVKLTAINCETLPDGRYSDGDGLYLIVSGDSRAWTLVYTSPVTGKRREMGLGKLSGVGLKKARTRAGEKRDKVRAGIDPIEEKKATRAAGAAAEAERKEAIRTNALTLRRVARTYHEAAVEPKRGPKHSQQWINSIEQHVPAAILDRPIASIRAAELLDALRPIYADVPETARRIKQRLDAVYDDAVLRELVVGNPVKAIGRALRDEERERGSFAALPYAEVPALVERLRALPGTSARALEFAILTAARTSEVLDMPWHELSDDSKVWTIPAARMKGREEHVVYLSDAARAVLDRVSGDSKQWCFRSPVADAPLSNMAMLTLLRRLELDDRTTVHGVCRASFSTWAYETAAARPDVIEASLAHKEADRVKRAYNRAQFIEERRELLAKWAAFVAPMSKPARKSASVHRLPKRAR